MTWLNIVSVVVGGSRIEAVMLVSLGCEAVVVMLFAWTQLCRLVLMVI